MSGLGLGLRLFSRLGLWTTGSVYGWGYRQVQFRAMDWVQVWIIDRAKVRAMDRVRVWVVHRIRVDGTWSFRLDKFMCDN